MFSNCKFPVAKLHSNYILISAAQCSKQHETTRTEINMKQLDKLLFPEPPDLSALMAARPKGKERVCRVCGVSGFAHRQALYRHIKKTHPHNQVGRCSFRLEGVLVPVSLVGGGITSGLVVVKWDDLINAMDHFYFILFIYFFKY